VMAVRRSSLRRNVFKSVYKRKQHGDDVFCYGKNANNFNQLDIFKIYEHNDTIKRQRSLHFVPYLFPNFQCCVGLDEMSLLVNNTSHANCDGITEHEVHYSITRIRYNIKHTDHSKATKYTTCKMSHQLHVIPGFGLKMYSVGV